MVEAVNNVSSVTTHGETKGSKDKTQAYAMLYYATLTMLGIVNKTIAVKSKEVNANASAQTPLQDFLAGLKWLIPDSNHDPVTMQAYLANLNAQNKETGNEQQDIQAKMAALQQIGSELMGEASSEMANVPQTGNLINGMQEALDDIDHAYTQMSLSNQP